MGWWNKRKNKKKKRNVNLFTLPDIQKGMAKYKLSDVKPTLAGYEMSPITDPFLIDITLEAIKPVSLPEQKVFDNVEELENSL